MNELIRICQNWFSKLLIYIFQSTLIFQIYKLFINFLNLNSVVNSINNKKENTRKLCKEIRTSWLEGNETEKLKYNSKRCYMQDSGT